MDSEAADWRKFSDQDILSEFKALQSTCPEGIYVLPSFDDIRRWHGIVFVHKGMLKGGAFKFVIHISDRYPEERPRVIFCSFVFHPLVQNRSGELDLSSEFSPWKPRNHNVFHVIRFLKKILADPSDCITNSTGRIANREAMLTLEKDKARFVRKCKKCVDESLQRLYENDEDSSLVFTPPKPEHLLLESRVFSMYLKKNSAGMSEEIQKNSPSLHPESPSKPNYTALFSDGIGRLVP